MSVWEYKIISSGKGGFATPALMESFLNQLGKEEWEIIHFHTPADNSLAFSGLARRSTQRDWTLEDAVAAAARAEAEKLRTEFEAKFKGAGGEAHAAAEDKPESLATQKADADDGFRKLRDTERDQEHESEEPAAAEGELDDWQKLAQEEELPSFFEAIQPLMRRNQRGAGMSVGVDHLAKKWGMPEEDIMGALKECGFAIPHDEDDPPAYVEYDGDLFWVNMNRRGEIWVNTKEKPRPVFKAVKAERFMPEVKEGSAALPEGHAPAAADEGPVTSGEFEAGARHSAGASSAQAGEGRAGGTEAEARGEAPAAGQGRPERSERPDRPERSDRQERPSRSDRPDRGERQRQNDRPEGQDRSDRPPSAGGGKAGLPEGQDLLNRIKPLMRRARGGEGGSGSVGFLSRGLKCRENELVAAFNSMGLTLPGGSDEPATEVVLGDALWWLNRDHRGGVWINARKPGTEKAAGSEGSAPAGGGAPAPMSTEEPAATGSSIERDRPAADPASETAPHRRRRGDEKNDPVPGSAADPGMSSEAPAMPATVSDAGGSSSETGREDPAETTNAGQRSPGAEPRIARSPRPSAGMQSQPADVEPASPASENKPAASVPALIAQLRPLLKETRTGTLAGEVGTLAESTGQNREALIAALVSLGLAVPEKSREKPAAVDFGGEPVWLSKNAKDEIWFNAKPYREAVPEKKPRKPRRAPEPEQPEPPTA